MSERKGLANDSYGRVFDDDEDSKGHARDLNVGGYLSGVVAKVKAGHQNRMATYGVLDWAALFLPCIAWLRRYKVREYLPRDLVAGLSIGAMVIPQGMSYAILAGLPPEFGLYGAFVPVLIYALFGSSPQLAVGPVAVTSLLLSTGLHDIITEVKDSGITDPTKLKTPEQKAAQELYNNCAIQVALLVSIGYTAIGVFQLGFLANFLSHSVISGFTSGAAIVIGTSQLKYFFGVKTPNTSTLHKTIDALADAIKDKGVNWREMLMFAAWLALLLTIKELAKRVKKLSWLRAIGPMSVALLGIILVAAFDLQDHNIKIVASIPAGLPSFTGNLWGPIFRGETKIGKQLTLALIVMIVDFMESISIATMLARRGKYQIQVTQEIIGLGIANFFGSMFSAYTTTGSFSRSAVSADIGSKTGLFGIVTSLLVMFVLLVLTPVFEKVPYNAMGAIIVSACIGLFQMSEAIFLYRANFLDFIVWLAAFFGTIFAGVEIGLGIAIGLALLLVIYQSAYPHTAALGRLPGTTVYRSIAQYPNATQQKGMVIMRVDAPIYFANVQWIRTKLERYLEAARAEPVLCPIKFLILDMSPVPFIDATGMHALLDLCTQLKDDGVQMVLANPCSNVKDQLARVHVLEAVGKDWIFVRTSDAVDVCSRVVMENNGDILKDDYKEGRAVTEGHEASTSIDPTLPINWPRD